LPLKRYKKKASAEAETLSSEEPTAPTFIRRLSFCHFRQSTFTTAPNPSLPAVFRPLFWSYHFADLDPQANIVQLINYGTLAHWRWLIEQYGKGEIRKTINPRTRSFASLIFSITSWRYAP
jgi:hypothetical protein